MQRRCVGEHIEELVCPGGPHGLTLQQGAVEGTEGDQDRQTGMSGGWPDRADSGSSLPRFVPNSGYQENFGEQWNRFRRTQLDKFNEPLSKSDFTAARAGRRTS